MSPTGTPSLASKILGGAFVLLPGLFVLTGIITLVKTAVFVSRATKVQGQVVSLARDSTSDGAQLYHPVFVFVDSAGMSHTQQSSFGSTQIDYAPGTTIDVLYDPADPKHSEIASNQTIWGRSFAAIVLGLTSGGVLYLVYEEQRAKTGEGEKRA